MLVMADSSGVHMHSNCKERSVAGGCLFASGVSSVC